jgi:hypothetical protein
LSLLLIVAIPIATGFFAPAIQLSCETYQNGQKQTLDLSASPTATVSVPLTACAESISALMEIMRAPKRKDRESIDQLMLLGQIKRLSQGVTVKVIHSLGGPVRVNVLTGEYAGELCYMDGQTLQ